MNDVQQLSKVTHRYLRNVLHGFIVGETVSESLPQRHWPCLEKIALQQGLFPILLRALPETRIPDETARRWQHATIRVLMQNMRALQTTVEVLGVLEGARIPVACLRGISLAHRIYPDPMLRPMADVDLFVPTDAREALECLAREGVFGPTERLRSQIVFGRGGIRFEVHWSLLTPKRYRNSADFNAWLADRRSYPTALGPLPCLAPEHDLLGLVCHWGIHHELEGFLRAVDIALFIQQNELDWDYINCWCRQNRLTRLLHFSIAYVDYLLGLSFSSHLSSTDHHLPTDSRRLFQAYLLRSLGQDTALTAFRRKKNLFFFAESTATKLREAIRLLDLWHYVRAL